MRKLLKFLHTLGSCGLIGGLLVYMIVLGLVPQDTPADFVGARRIIGLLGTYILLPSMGACLATGLMSISVHRPFQELRWVWVKAALGIGMFEGTLGLQSKASHAVGLSEALVEGKTTAAAVAAELSSEWYLLAAIMTLAIANIVLGVWRPVLRSVLRRG